MKSSVSVMQLMIQGGAQLIDNSTKLSSALTKHDPFVLVWSYPGSEQDLEQRGHEQIIPRRRRGGGERSVRSQVA
jgi:hypothetical protein